MTTATATSTNSTSSATSTARKAFTVSAPGKVILFGEHAVVYGKHAIAASVDLCSYAHIEPLPSTTTTASASAAALDEPVAILTLPDVNVDSLSVPLSAIPDVAGSFDLLAKHPLEVINESLVINDLLLKRSASASTSESESHEAAAAMAAIKAFAYLLSAMVTPAKRTEGSFKLTVRSAIPVGAGMGSSAAYSVCVAAALALFFDLGYDADKFADQKSFVNNWAFKAEQVIHGNPSGVDNTVSSFGGFNLYRSGKVTHIKQSGSGNQQQPQHQRVIIVNTRVPRSTIKLVGIVRELHAMMPAVVDSIMESVDNISLTYRSMIENPESDDTSSKKLAKLVSVNHQLLNTIGAGHPALDNVVSIASKYNIPAKLTGAGGGGCAVMFIPSQSSEASKTENIDSNEDDDNIDSVIASVTAELAAAGFICYPTSVAGAGVSVASFDAGSSLADDDDIGAILKKCDNIAQAMRNGLWQPLC